jgi:hypothetical protein
LSPPSKTLINVAITTGLREEQAMWKALLLAALICNPANDKAGPASVLRGK